MVFCKALQKHVSSIWDGLSKGVPGHPSSFLSAPVSLQVPTVTLLCPEQMLLLHPVTSFSPSLGSPTSVIAPGDAQVTQVTAEP